MPESTLAVCMQGHSKLGQLLGENRYPVLTPFQNCSALVPFTMIVLAASLEFDTTLPSMDDKR